MGKVPFGPSKPSRVPEPPATRIDADLARGQRVGPDLRGAAPGHALAVGLRQPDRPRSAGRASGSAAAAGFAVEPARRSGRSSWSKSIEAISAASRARWASVKSPHHRSR